mmetsp:Transcript_22165/g.53702  ORF Transcript_22165/g.53702 Transcript_22165/m.53702 type:complete len:222 (+) Transcript_22165:556-1221(+)
MLTEVPRCDLAACKLDAVHARLLPSADPDHHAVLREADGVALRVLNADARHDHVADGALGQGVHAALRHDLLGHVLLRDHDVVPLLAERHPVHLAVLDRIGDEVGLRLEDDELPSLFGFEYGQRLGSEPGRDDAVAHLLFQDERRVLVDDVAHSGEISEGAHGIGISGTEVGQRAGRELGRRVGCDLVGPALDVGQGHGDGRASGADVLEAGRGGKAGGLS